MQKYERLKGSIYAFYIVLLLVIIVTTLIVYDLSSDTSNAEAFSVFDIEWYDNEGNIVDLEDIRKSTIASCTLPQIKEETTLFFRVKNLNVDIYVDDVLYKQYGSDNISTQAWYKTPGTYYVQIVLQPNNSRVTLDINNPYTNDSSCNIKQIYLGDAQSIIRMFALRALPGFSICMLIIIIGIILCMLSFIFRKYDAKNKDMLSLGLFACIIGVWSMTETRMLPLLTDQSSAMHLLASSTLMIVGVPILIFFKDQGNTTDKVAVPIVSILTAISFAVSYILHFFGIADMHETIKLSHATIIVSCLFIFYYAFKALRNSSLKDPTFWGLFSIAGCALIDTVLYYLQLTTDNSAFARAGVLIYVSMLSSKIIGGYIEAYSENVKAAMLTKMAYFDVLTEFYNHNSFASDLKAIDKDVSAHRGKAIIVFDMNCLKYINDHYGHAMGDAALKESSEYISKNFSSLGKCYRIGGDEYAVITNEAIKNKPLYDITTKFLADVDDRNKQEIPDKPYPLHIAVGYSIIESDATATFNIADARMYANKQAIKTKLKAENAELVRT